MSESGRKFDKICVICGDRSRGYNFNAITCDSCRAFFRRTISNNRTFECKSMTNCVISYKTRHNCKFCRLNKCFAMGMKKELVQTREEIISRKQLILENKQKTQNLVKIDDIDDIILYNNKDNNTDILKSITEQLGLNDEDINMEIDKIESYLLSDETKDYLNKSIDADLCFTKSIEKSSKYGAIVPIFKTLLDYNGFNQLESNRMTELFDASNVFGFVIGYNKINITNKQQLMAIGTPSMAKNMSSVVTFSKKLNAFKDFCEEDQLALMKMALFEVFLLRFMTFYDSQHKKMFYYYDKDNHLEIDLDVFNY